MTYYGSWFFEIRAAGHVLSWIAAVTSKNIVRKCTNTSSWWLISTVYNNIDKTTTYASEVYRAHSSGEIQEFIDQTWNFRKPYITLKSIYELYHPYDNNAFAVYRHSILCGTSSPVSVIFIRRQFFLRETIDRILLISHAKSTWKSAIFELTVGHRNILLVLFRAKEHFFQLRESQPSNFLHTERRFHFTIYNLFDFNVHHRVGAQFGQRRMHADSFQILYTWNRYRGIHVLPNVHIQLASWHWLEL